MMGMRKGGEKARRGASWSGAAFLVESMLLLVLLAVSMCVFVQVFGLSVQRSYEGEGLSRAIAAAESEAERFANDPASADGSADVGGMRVVCAVEEERQPHGILYRATIRVFDSMGAVDADSGQEPVYEVATAKYVSEVER